MLRAFSTLLTRRLPIMAEISTTSPLPAAAAPTAILTQNVPIPPRGVDYRGKVVLAPMVRSGELPARLTALHYGADLVWGPETIDKAIIGCTRHVCDRTNTVYFSRKPSNNYKESEDGGKDGGKESVLFRTHPENEKDRLIYQIGTADPGLAVQAAKMVAADVAGIDLNSGCPKPFSTSGGMGAALLRTPDLLCSILSALVTEVGIPHQIGISVKIRLLETEEKTIALVHRLVRTGITGLTIHCRTTPMRPRERAIRHQLKAIVATCHEAGVSCTMNGDVYGRKEALQLIEEFGADGAMIATAAEKNPSVFRSPENGGLAPWREYTRYYFEQALAVDNRWGNTKFTLAQIIPGKEKGIDVAKMKSHVEVCRQLGYEDLMQKATEQDERLGIGLGLGPQRQKKREAQREAENNGKRKKMEREEEMKRNGDAKKAKMDKLSSSELTERAAEALKEEMQEQTQQAPIANGVGAALAT